MKQQAQIKIENSCRKTAKKAIKNSGKYWEIEDVLGERPIETGGKEVLIKWKNWSSKYNSWEPVENLNDNFENILQTLQNEEVEKKTKKTKRKMIRRTKRKPNIQTGWGELEDIIDKKIIKGKTHYLIKWLGYSDEYNTWEPRSNLAAININCLKRRLRQERTKPSQQKIEEDRNNEAMDIDQEQKIIEKQEEENNVIEEYQFFEGERAASNNEIDNEVYSTHQYFVPENECSKVTECKSRHEEQVDTSECMIQSHICNDRGEIEAFKFFTIKSSDSLSMPVTYWYSIQEAREKCPGEVITYLFDLVNLNRANLSPVKFNNL